MRAAPLVSTLLVKQKRGQVAASAQDRLALVEAATEGIDGLEASALEIERLIRDRRPEIEFVPDWPWSAGSV